jgi:signal transduction histidine kinase
MITAVLLVGNWSYTSTEKSTLHEFNQRQMVMAKSVSSAVQFYFRSIAGYLRLIATIPDIAALDEDFTRRELAHIYSELKRLGVNDIGILDTNGTVRYNVEAPVIEEVDFSWRRYFKRAQKSRTNEDFFKVLQEIKTGQPGMSEYAGLTLNSSNDNNLGEDTFWLIAHAPIMIGDQLWTISVVAPKSDVESQITSEYRRHLIVMGLSILIIVASASYILSKSLKAGRTLQQEVDRKTTELMKTQDQVNRLRRKQLEQVICSQEEERKRISRELHDEFGQELAAMLLLIETGRQQTVLKGERLEKLHSLVRSSIETANRIAWDLRPIILDDYGLSSALDQYIKKTTEWSNVQIDYKIVSPKEENPRLSSPTEISLYRITQEALKNAIEHAAPSRVSVILVFASEKVTLLIEDNGSGFEVDNAPASYYGHGLGLLGMRERVALLKGTIVIESEMGRGTTIKVTLPR